MKNLILIISVLFLLVGCSSNKIDYENISGEEILNELDSKIYTEFNKTEQELVKEIGKPDQIDTIAVENKHTGIKDNIYTLHYDDYDLSLYHSIELDKYLLQSVLFKSDDMLEDYYITYGMKKDDLKFLSSYKVKETGDKDNSEIIYSAGTEPGYESLFVFSFDGNLLKQVKYSAPID